MNSKTPRLLLPLGLAALTACTNTMTGKVDGEPVDQARSAVFDEVTYEVPFLGDVRFMLLYITSMDDACEVFHAIADNTPLGCDDTCDEYTELASEYLGRDEYWNLTMAIHIEDETVREFYYDPELGDDEFRARIERWDVSLLYDRPACEDACEDGESVFGAENDDGEGGNLAITAYDSERVEGEYLVDFGGEDSVSGRFAATWCDLDALVWWL